MTNAVAIATPSPLDELAAEISAAWRDSKAQQVGAWEGYVVTGRLLTQARDHFKTDRDFGQWFNTQGFGFSRVWAWNLIQIGRDEAAARAVVSALTTDTGRVPGVEAVVRQLKPARQPKAAKPRASRERDKQDPAITVFLSFLKTQRSGTNVNRSALKRVDTALHAYFTQNLIDCQH